MIINNFYRLSEYKIIEDDNGALGWESHFGIVWWKAHTGYNSFKVGACSVAEDTLFIGIKDHEESGGPKKAFLDYLRRLPEWIATSYYCLNCTLHE
jgi:hypothetical protein